MPHLGPEDSSFHPPGDGGGQQDPAPAPAPAPAPEQDLPEGVEIVEVDGEQFIVQTPGPQVITQQTNIPSFLKDIIQQRAAQQNRFGNFSFAALRGLRNQTRGDLVAPLNQDQLDSLTRQRNIGNSRAARRPAILANQIASQGTNLGLERLKALSQLQGGGAGAHNLKQIAAGSSPQDFSNAFSAAVREIQPQISSRFALSGRTGGGLAQAAQTQATSDAFARLFNQDQQRRLAASNALSNLQLQSSLALPGAQQAHLAQRFNAAKQIPDLSLIPSRLVGGVGDTLQQQRQRERDIPLQAQQRLASLGLSGFGAGAFGVPSGLTGSTRTSTVAPQVSPLSFAGGGGGSSGGGAGGFISGALGGAGTGAAIGSVVPGIGTAVGAGVGGVLGGLGSLL